MSRHDDDKPARVPPPAGCGRCSTVGLAEVAVHYAARVELRSAHCTCELGQYWAAKRLESSTSGGYRGVFVTEFAEAMARRKGVLACYMFPTEAEKRLDLTPRKLTPESEANLRAYLADIATKGRSAPPPTDDDRYPDDRW